ncbi:MAG TPA: response regulator transcription factor [Dehalococcoidia bacterium]|jgi:DNA-binding response OmpR family regulator|nr:response regulator transcription factor [Dehalococcoidia bacterium]
MKMLLVEDDADLMDVLTFALRRKGHSIIAATDGQQGLERWKTERPSLVIADVNLPRMGGLELCRRIRETSSVPVILMSGSVGEQDIIRGLEVGADEYVTKPFSVTQLTLRIDAMNRRVRAAATGDFEGNINVGDLIVNPEFCSVHRDGREVRLTRMEFRILYCLAANAGRVVVTSRLADFAWQGVAEGDPALLKTHISRIRRKLALSPDQPGFIRSVPGLGYSLAVA